MKKLDFIIFIENRNRDLESACLLKCELQRRGYSVLICSALYWGNFTTLLFREAKIIIVPGLYNNLYVKKYIAFSKSLPHNIINLQQEQVVAPAYIESETGFPSGYAQSFYHVCWNYWRQSCLKRYGTPESHAWPFGSMNLDLTRPMFQDYFPSRAELAKRYQLDINKKWSIFISSFACPQEYVELYKKQYPNTKDAETVSQMGQLQSQSRPVILEWIQRFLKENPNFEFIYRPHPSEVRDSALDSFAEKNDRFHVINNESLRIWIQVCDVLNNWLSTSIADVYFMHKNCSIVRPVDIPTHLDYEILNKKYFICTYNEFVDYQLAPQNYPFPVHTDILLDMYIYDDIPTFVKICNKAEELYHAPANSAINEAAHYEISDKSQFRPFWKELRFWLYSSISVYIPFSKFLRGTKKFSAQRIEKESLGIYKEMHIMEKKIRKLLDEYDNIKFNT